MRKVVLLLVLYEMSFLFTGLRFFYIPLIESIWFSMLRIIEVKFLSIGVIIFFFRSLVLGHSAIDLFAIFRGDLLLVFPLVLFSVELWILSIEFNRFSIF